MLKLSRDFITVVDVSAQLVNTKITLGCHLEYNC